MQEQFSYVNIGGLLKWLCDGSWEEDGLLSPGHICVGDGQLADEVLGRLGVRVRGDVQRGGHPHRVEAPPPDGGGRHLRAIILFILQFDCS